MLSELLESTIALCMMTLFKRRLLLIRIILRVIRPRKEWAFVLCCDDSNLLHEDKSQGLNPKERGFNKGKMKAISTRIHCYLSYLSLRHPGRCCVFLGYVHYSTDTNIL